MQIKNSLTTVPVPNLPLAPVEYEGRYHDQNNNVLRLFFNQAYGAVGTLIGPLGAQHLNAPLLSAYDTSNQYDGSTSIPYAVRLSNTAIGKGFTVGSRAFSGTGSIATTTMTITAVASGRLYPSMLLSGTGVSANTYVYLQLSSTATAIANTPTGTGTSGTAILTVSDATGIEARQFVSGTGVPANTRVISVSGNDVTLSANLTAPASGTYTFRPWGYQGTYSVNPSQTVASTTITGELKSLIIPEQPGIYNVQFSIQFTNTDLNKDHEVDVWFRKNDADMADSNSQFSVPGAHAGHNGQLIAALNYFVELQANDELEIVWHTSDSTVFIETIAATSSPIRPRTPSVIVTVTFVSTITTA